ncbi:MAG TPA: ferritin [Solirubrobacterales bacterium]|nr:ferritin [Solirubrobacterales bacterium]
MPSERLIDALNEQIGREYAAAHQYVAIASYYDVATYPNLARLFNEQAEEEREHAAKMVGYLIDSGATPKLAEIAAPRDRFDDHVEPINLALEQERSNTVAINKLFDIARETRDHASEVFLHWFINEQVEEESRMESLLEVAERVRDFPMMLDEFVYREGDKLGEAETD